MRAIIWLAAMLFSTAAFAQAASIEVNQGEWDQLTEFQQQSIEALVKESFPEMQLAIAPSPGAMTAASQPKAAKPFCTAFCDFSAAVIGIGCPAIGGSAGPVLVSLCGVVAAQAKAACYKRCGAAP